MSDAFIISTAKGESLLITVASDLKLSVTHTYPVGSSFSAAVDRDGKSHLASVTLGADGAVVTTKASSDDVQTGAAVPHFSSATHGAATHAFLNVFAKKDGTVGTRILVTSDDHALTLIQVQSIGTRIVYR